MGPQSFFRLALAGLAALAVLLLLTGYGRAARVASGKQDSRILIILQVLAIMSASMGAAIFAIVAFLSGHPIQGIVVFVLMVTSTLMLSAGTRLAWARHGKPDAVRQAEAERQYRREVTQAPAIVPWGFLAVMSFLAVLSTVMFVAFNWLFPGDPDLGVVAGLLPPAIGMGLACVTVMAAQVRGRQPFSASLVVSLTVVPVLLGLGAYSAWRYPSETLLPGWTQFCAFISVMTLGAALAIRSIARKALHDEAGCSTDDAQLTSTSS